MIVEQEKLDDLCLLIADCPHSTPKWTSSGVVVLRNQNIKNGRLDLSNPSFTDENNYLERTRRAVPTANDIVITREAPMGDVCLIPKGLKSCLGQRQVLIRPNPNLISPQFLLYAFQSDFVQNQIRWNEGTGSTVSNVRIPELKKLKIPIFDLQVQHKIARTLGALDDKIELNWQMNATLEAIARALFKAWFVDFEPVRANLENRPSESASPEIAKLFPSEFENSIPKGWTDGSIGELAIISKKSLSPNKFPEESFNHFSIPAFDEGKRPKTEEGNSIQSNKFLIERDSVLVSKLNPRIFRAWTAYAPKKENRCVASTEFIILQTPNSDYWSFLNFLIRSEGIISKFQQRVTGTSSSHQRVKPESILDLGIVIPNDEVAKTFNKIVAPTLLTIEENLEQIQRLAELRDSLLPRLISGKLPVRKIKGEAKGEIE